MADDPQAQHYVECTQCNRNAEFYCNTCADRLCKKCKKKHLLSNASSHHNVVLYQEKQTSAPKPELCHIHSALPYIMCCQQCEIPVCQQCIKDQHKKHSFVDIDVVFERKKEEYKDKVFKIKDELLPRSTALLEDVREDNAKFKEVIAKIHSSMTSKAQVLKDFIDTVLAENTEFLQGLENSLISQLQQQEKTMNNYIACLQNIVDEYENCEFMKNPARFILFQHKNPISKEETIPKLNTLTLPSFFDGKVSKDDIAKLFGKLQEFEKTQGLREVKKVQAVKKSETSMKLIPTATKMISFTAPGVNDCRHISPATAEQAWVSDFEGNLVMTNVKGEKLKTMEYKKYMDGCHTVSQSGDLFFLKDSYKTIYKVAFDKKEVVCIITIPSGYVRSLYSSPLTGDILVGMQGPSKVIRYKKTGQEVHQIQYDNTWQPLYGYPHYITENHINGDVCVSDCSKCAVVVVDRDGNHRFSYTGHPPGSEFVPFGISTDTQGHILMSDQESVTVQMTDKDGHFLSFLLTEEQGIGMPLGLSLDIRNKLLWVGQYQNEISVYSYKPQ